MNEIEEVLISGEYDLPLTFSLFFSHLDYFNVLGRPFSKQQDLQFPGMSNL